MNPEPKASGLCVRSILMADIVSSTALYEQLGNLAARKQVGDRLARLSVIVEEQQGKVVKSLGDGLLCTFVSHERAVLAAIRMCAPTADELQVRVGVCCGDVVEETADVFGDAVNTAARIAALAKPSEVLISRTAMESLPYYMRTLMRPVPALSVKGKQEPIEVFAVLEGDLKGSDRQTVQCSDPSRIAVTRLELAYGQQTLILRSGGELIIGREPGNDMVVTGPHVSRHHARIFHRQGKFVLVDQSANGTYLVPELRPGLHLLREEAILHDSGCIYLGADPATTTTTPICYRTE